MSVKMACTTFKNTCDTNLTVAVAYRSGANTNTKGWYQIPAAESFEICYDIIAKDTDLVGYYISEQGFDMVYPTPALVPVSTSPGPDGKTTARFCVDPQHAFTIVQDGKPCTEKGWKQVQFTWTRRRDAFTLSCSGKGGDAQLTSDANHWRYHMPPANGEQVAYGTAKSIVYGLLRRGWSNVTRGGGESPRGVHACPLGTRSPSACRDTQSIDCACVRAWGSALHPARPCHA